MSREQVLVVDDDPDLRRLLEIFLVRQGMEVSCAHDGATALHAAATSAPDVVLLDLGLPDIPGMEVLRTLRAAGDPPAIVVMTGQPTYEAAVLALQHGADNFVTKPLDLDLLQEILRKAAQSSHLRRRLLSSAPLALEQLRLCPSPAMRRLVQSLGKVAESDGNVLISGETGSGKGLVARALHETSPRAQGAFVELNCASLSREMLESELFGHAAGAFTGAARAKPGLFEVADGGTLFLDEVGDMDPAVQPKVLKAIEDRRIRRLGSVQARAVDARIVAASHFDLAALAADGRFRSDLFFRLDVLRLHVAPLRQRREDIPVLAHEILRRARPGSRRPSGFTDEALAWLAGQPWPGNVRELQNVVERAAVHAGGERIGREHLDLHAPASPEPARSAESGDDADLTLDGAERRHVERVLRRCGGNKSEAARLLGITRQTLLRKLRGWGLSSGER